MNINFRDVKNRNQQGFILVTTLLMISLLLTLLATYYATTSIETASSRYTRGSVSGFYSAEGGLNLRAENIRSVFVGFNRPAGTSPTSTNPCEGTNMGSGDYQCRSYALNNRTAKTYVNEDPANPVILTIPPGERYQYLNAQEYRYTAKSVAINNRNDTEADLELRFKSRLVPLFQFAAFYNKDLEILPGPAMTLSGPVHTNGSLWLYSNSASLDISGQVTVVGDLWRGRKDNSVSPSCNNRPVRIADPLTQRSLIPTCPSRYRTTASDITAWNGMIQTKVPSVTVPGPEVFDPTPGAVYWDRADLRLVLNVDNNDKPTSIEVKNSDNTTNAAATATLLACTGQVVNCTRPDGASPVACTASTTGKAVGYRTFYNNREGKFLTLLDMDLTATMNCLHTSNWFGTGKQLSDITEGGIVFHMTVKGNNSNSSANRFGIRIRNAQKIGSNIAGAPAVKGFTLVSDQAAYTWGHINSTNKIPMAVMSDSLNILSTNWSDVNAQVASCNSGSRTAANTTINSAFLAGTDSTGGIEGDGGINGYYNGGLENYPRLHENWSSRTLVYRGSFVSLGVPRHVTGRWSNQCYNPPARDWNYDTSFNNAANLPPITPRFVYLRQELFVRDFER